MEQLSLILDKCLRAGADMAEVYHISERTLNITVRNGRVQSILQAQPGGMAVRFFSFGRLAFGHVSDTSNRGIDRLVGRLSKLAKKADKDEYAVLPQPSPEHAVARINDRSFASQPTQTKIDYLINLEEMALACHPWVKRSDSVWYRESLASVTIANTLGLRAGYESSQYTVGLTVIAEKDGRMYPGEGRLRARVFDDLPEAEKIAEKYASKAARLVGGTSVDSGDYEIIFSPEAAVSLLWGLAGALNGENVLKGASFLAGKEGARIGVEALSVIDDPLLPGGVGSRPVDDEGVASRKLVLIDAGVVTGFLYDTRTARKAGKNPTASANREGYTSLPAIAPSNFYVAPGSTPVEDLIASCRKGILVETTQGWGLHSITGIYSAGIDGMLILNGKSVRPVNNVTIAGSADSILGGIKAIGNDLAFFDSFCSPSLLIEKMHVGS